MGVKSSWASRVMKMASIGDSVSERHFRKDAADGDGLSSEGKGF